MSWINCDFDVNPDLENRDLLRVDVGMVRISSNMAKKIGLGRRDVVALKGNGKTIYREVFGGANFRDDILLLDYDSCLQLGIQYRGRVTIQARPAGKMPLYWNHPEHSLRLGFRLGVVGLILGVFGLLVGILGYVR